MAEKKGTQKKPDEPEQNKKKKLIIIGAVVLFLLLIGLGTGLFFFGKKAAAPETPTDPGQQVPVPELNKSPAVGPMVNIDEFIVNIISAENNHYVKASLTLELTNIPVKDEVTLRMPQIRDSILLLVSNKTYEELQDLQGKKQLKAEITSKLNAILQSGSVTSIYFTDFVVQ
jgi:flagellar FliL protein